MFVYFALTIHLVVGRSLTRDKLKNYNYKFSIQNYNYKFSKKIPENGVKLGD